MADAERRHLGNDVWGTMSVAGGVAYIDKWLQSAAAGQLKVIACTMAERGELVIAAELERVATLREEAERWQPVFDKS